MLEYIFFLNENWGPTQAQHNFCFSKKQNGGAGKKWFYQNFGHNFYFFFKIICGTIQHNVSTTQHNFCFSKKQNGGAGKKLLYQNFGPNFYFFQKSFAAQFSTNLAQFSTTFVFLRKQNSSVNFLDMSDCLGWL